MEKTRTIGTAWRWLIGPEPWPARRIVGEATALLLITVSAFGLQLFANGVLLAAVAALGALLIAALRRPLPAVALLVTAGLGGGSVLGLALLLPVVAWSAGRRLKRPARALTVFGAAFVLHLLMELLSVMREGVALNSGLVLIFSALWFLAAAVVPGLVARYLSQRRTLLASVQAQHRQLLRENAIIAREAQLRERQRIAQDMHDSLGHQLTLIAVHTGALQVDPELSGSQRVAVGVLRDASVNAMRELREVVGVLREDASDATGSETADAPPSGNGLDAVEQLVGTSRAAGAAVALHRRGTPRSLPPVADRAAYRIVQEGLTNAHKHAFGAPITVALEFEPDSLLVEVVNGPVPADLDGRHSPRVSGGRGLAGLGERARLAGGMLHRGPAPGGGFRLAGVLPYEATGVGRRPEDPVDHGREETAGAAPGDVLTTSSGTPHGRRGGLAGSVKSLGVHHLAGSPHPPGNGSPTTAGGDGPGDPGLLDPADPRVRAHQDFARLLDRRRRACFPWGCGIAGVTLVLVVALLVWGLTAVVREFQESMIDPDEYKAMKVGQSESSVRERLPEGGALLTSGLTDDEPPVPRGAHCLHLMSSEDTGDWSTDVVFRFCFRDDVLVAKDRYISTS